jgi:hypothetical protein
VRSKGAKRNGVIESRRYDDPNADQVRDIWSDLASYQVCIVPFTQKTRLVARRVHGTGQLGDTLLVSVSFVGVLTKADHAAHLNARFNRSVEGYVASTSAHHEKGAK